MISVNLLDNLVEDDLEEEVMGRTETFHGALYPGEVAQFQYEDNQLRNIDYVRKNFF